MFAHPELTVAVRVLCRHLTNTAYASGLHSAQLLMMCFMKLRLHTIVTIFLGTDITTASVIDCMVRYSESPNTRLSNLAKLFLEDICSPEQINSVANAASAAVP
uniref:Uncharacterized protein n=1 Tax=Rhipicephalus microplus TaxID=6941 RepID=A0A6G5ADG1_RHIMP